MQCGFPHPPALLTSPLGFSWTCPPIRDYPSLCYEWINMYIYLCLWMPRANKCGAILTDRSLPHGSVHGARTVPHSNKSLLCLADFCYSLQTYRWKMMHDGAIRFPQSMLGKKEADMRDLTCLLILTERSCVTTQFFFFFAFWKLHATQNKTLQHLSEKP